MASTIFKLNAINDWIGESEDNTLMPVIFVGHGSPMNAIETNPFSMGMQKMGQEIIKPKAILMISAHWETKGTFVTAQDMPPTIHDFGGFPKELFDTIYPAQGSKWLANETIHTVKSTTIAPNSEWGFDHGCWSVTKNMFPKADIPIIQMSLDYRKDAQYHYNLGKELYNLRKKGVLIVGSGNMVHNFNYMMVRNGDFNQPLAHDWAIEANESFKSLILKQDHKSLISYKSYSKALQLSAPTPEHYLPLLYILALGGTDEKIAFFNDTVVGGSFSMTSVKIG